MSDWCADRRLLITGGLGFLGLNLAASLLSRGAAITLVDLAAAPAPAQLRYLGGGSPRLRYVSCDVRDTERLATLLPEHEVLFHLAAHGGHLASLRQPLLDLDVNCRSVAALLEACRLRHPRLRIVFTSTRQVYGRAAAPPADESHPTRPPDVNGVNKLAAEHYLRLYAEVYGLSTISLRLANTYGPGMTLDDPERGGVVGVWLGRALRGEPLIVFGGDQLRDFNHVDDVVAALQLAAQHADDRGHTYNLGAPRPRSLRQVAETLAAILPVEVRVQPLPAERRAIDVGDLTCDFRRFRAATGWSPSVDLEPGLRQTIRHFQEHTAPLV